MAKFQHVGLIGTGHVTNVTDLSFAQAGGRTLLVGATHVGGGMTLWDASAPGQIAALIASHDYAEKLRHFAEPQALVLTRPVGVSVLPGGLGGGVDWAQVVGPDGTGWAEDPGVIAAPLPSRMLDAREFTSWQGVRYLAVTEMGRASVSLWKVADSGALSRVVVSPIPPGFNERAQIDGIEHARLGGVDLLIGSSALGNFLSLHRVLPDGQLAAGQVYTFAAGTGFNRPRDIAHLAVDGQHYLVVAGTLSSSLTVLRIVPGVELAPVDHVLDEATTRFASATVMETVTIAGRSYVVVGGADDGLSLFTVAPGGRLIHLDTLQDRDGLRLADVSALTVRDAGGTIQIIAASATESGLTQLTVQPGPIGATRLFTATEAIGTERDDIIEGGRATISIEGGRGDDILISNAAAAEMVGGSGADAFMPTFSTKSLAIRDFQPGIDRLDFSMMGMIRSIYQVEFVQTETGAQLRLGSTVIDLLSADGGPIARKWFDNRMFPIAHYEPPSMHQTYVGTARADRLTVRYGSATMTGLDGNDTLTGGNFADRLYGHRGNDRLTGGDGNDRLSGGYGRDTMSGGAADDVLSGGSENDLLRGQTGNDTLDGQAGRDTLDGGSGNDVLLDRSGDNFFSDLYGDNRFTAGGGADRVLAGAGADWINAAGGADAVDAGDGSDTVYGANGSDRLAGGGGDDRLIGGAGDDTLDAQSGNDTADGGAEQDRLYGQDGDDMLFGGDGLDALWGGLGADLLDGGAHDDRLFGGGGADTLIGGAGVDLLQGGADDDFLWGGLGPDVLRGGAGADSFVCRSADETSVRQADRIEDFQHGIDRLDLTAMHLTGIGAASYSGAGGELRWVQKNSEGTLWQIDADVDGDRCADLRLHVVTDAPLTLDDFLL